MVMREFMGSGEDFSGNDYLLSRNAYRLKNDP